MECPLCRKGNDESRRFCASCGSVLPSGLPTGGTLTFIPSPEAFAAGTLFAGRYRVIGEIGHGGMGTVYKVFDDKVQETIALKIIRTEAARDRSSEERFRTELKLARRITHPRVCRVFDLGEDAGISFLTMEFVPGNDLARMIRSNGPLPPETAVGIARQIAEGLAAAHRLGVIHRDLKPRNVLIDESGAAKIMDFGIARSLLAGPTADEGRMIGTPGYMAPEQAAGKPADARADLYALGVILYEMVTGRRPFEGDTPDDLARKHRIDLPRPPIELNVRVPSGLNGTILKCLAKDPAERFQTADDLRAALSAPAPAPPRVRDERRRRGWRIRPRAIGLVLASAAMLGTAAFLIRELSPGGRTGRPSPLEAEASNRLAVLPLVDRSPNPGQVRFGEGLTNDIRTKMGAADLIKLIAKMSCEKFRDTKKELRAIGLALQARHILYGEYSVEGNRLRVYVYLGDAATDTEDWNQRYEKPLDDIFTVADLIATDVARELRVQFSPGRRQGLKKRDPVNIDAYRSYLLGQLHEKQYRRDGLESDYLESERSYLRATELDPRYALAFCGLGNLAEARYVKADPPSLAIMHRRFQQAHDLDSELAEAHIGLGLACLYENDPEQASKYTRSALASDPDNPDIIYGVGAFLRSVGLYDRALVHFLKAAELDRLNPMPGFNAAGCYWYLGRYDEAEARLRKVIAIDPGDYRNHLNLARQLLMKGRLDEAGAAIARAEEAAATPAAKSSTRRHQAWLAAAKGESSRALALLKGERNLTRYEITNIYCLLGLKNEALVQMDDGFRNGFELIKDYQYTFLYLERNPLLGVLREDPRFKDLLERARRDYDRWIRLCSGL